MKYKAVIFDLFGTLIENFTRSEYEQVLADMASIVSAPPDKFRQLWLDSFYERTTGIHPTKQASIEYICRKLDIPVTAIQVEQAALIRQEYTRRSFRLKPDAVEVLSTLKSQGFKIALVSDCSSEVPAVWKETPFTPFFDVTIFSCDAGVKKPDPRIYRMATDKLGVKPEDCLYVGDGSSNELTGALKVGMYPVLIRDPNEPVDVHYIEREDSWNGPMISSLTEVLNLVK
ncbi:MAG: hypothetical protein A2Y58_03695 [Chloroflexi bacterium RBG_13_51_52]|nr:MAG: hypothetical protein A2Y58_03695 [Chloroflexi bacterium RBG_13_51_52]